MNFGKKKEAIINVRITHEEKEKMIYLAKKLNFDSLSAWIVKILKKEINE